MVVGNLHVAGISILPDETDAVLVVDPDAVLSLPRAFQGFQTVTGNRRQIARRSRLVQMHELAERDLFDGPKLFIRPDRRYDSIGSANADHSIWQAVRPAFGRNVRVSLSARPSKPSLDPRSQVLPFLFRMSAPPRQIASLTLHANPESLKHFPDFSE